MAPPDPPAQTLLHSRQKSRRLRAAIWCLSILLAVVLVGLPFWWALPDKPIAEPPESPWPPERGIVFVGVQFVKHRRFDRPEAEKREFRERYNHAVFRVTPMRWTPGGLEQAEAFTLEARGYDHWRPLHPALAVERGELFVADGTTIQHRRPFSGSGVLSTGKVKRWATSMTARNGVVYVGSVGQVTAVDFNDGGRAQVLYTDPGMDPFEAWAKPVDFFLRVGDRLAAIDNVMVPKFGFVFERDASGTMAFRYRDGLPEGVNEQVTHGAVLDDAMVLLTRYGHRGGAGHCLHRCEVGANAIASEELPAIHHPFPRANARAPTTRVWLGAAGRLGRRLAPDAPGAGTFTASGGWMGIGVIDGHILLATTGRGILVLDPKAPAAATSVPVGGACGALLVVGETVLALVDDGKGSERGQNSYSRLVAYRWNGTARTLEWIREDRLATNLLRIAR